MKISSFTLLLLISTLAVAKNYPGMSEAEMQKIQEMQSCMEKVDQRQLKALEQRQNEFDAEVKSLCNRGKRDEAQKKAISFAKEMKNNPAIRAISKCGELAKGMMPEMSFTSHDDEDSGQHVCDSY